MPWCPSECFHHPDLLLDADGSCSNCDDGRECERPACHEHTAARLRAALAWYAQPTNYYATFHWSEAGYELQSPVLADRGARAREALGE